MRRRVSISRVCINVQHLDSYLLGDLAYPVTPGPPKIAARRCAVKEFYASKQGTVRNLKHTQTLNL